jgi:hypothetical protein
MMKISIAAFAAMATLGVSFKAEAASMRDAGTLTCHVGPGLGLVVGSVRSAQCVHRFQDRAGRRFVHNYAGSMRRTGFDVGLTSDQVMTWAVITPARRGRSDMLTGLFAGASADASVVVGGGTQASLGKTGPDIFLEPVSSSGQVGAGIGFGATGLELRRVPEPTYAVLR